MINGAFGQVNSPFYHNFILSIVLIISLITPLNNAFANGVDPAHVEAIWSESTLTALAKYCRKG